MGDNVSSTSQSYDILKAFLDDIANALAHANAYITAELMLRALRDETEEIPQWEKDLLAETDTAMIKINSLRGALITFMGKTEREAQP